MTDVVLTGMMGTGKTAVGRALAAAYGLPFVDTDEEVERRAGCTIAELWAARAEPAFRELETRVFRDLLAASGGPRVIATGAGTLVAERNRALLGPSARVFCLTCELPELLQRLQRQDRSARPLLGGEGHEDLAEIVSRRLEGRRAVYCLFDQVETTGRSIEDVAREVARRAGLTMAGCLTFENRSESELLFGRGLLDDLGRMMIARGLTGPALLISDRGARDGGWAGRALEALDAGGICASHLPLQGGEGDKTLACVERVYAACADRRFDRSSVIVAIGGGAICDLAGFVAATYLRGIGLALVPTTLLAQVDAAIGGKVGIDLHGLKNAAGAFYPARLIAVDPDALSTLPPPLLADGLAEIVKIAFIRSRALLEQVKALDGPAAILTRPDIVRMAGGEKIALVQADPYERGDRALLNFGHTVGHAVETGSDFRLSHGQAVSIGMVAETWLAEQAGWSEAGILQRLSTILETLHLPLSTADDPRRIIPLMGQDKKRRAGRLRFAVPTAAGEGRIVEITEEQAAAAVRHAVTGGER